MAKPWIPMVCAVCLWQVRNLDSHMRSHLKAWKQEVA